MPDARPRGPARAGRPGPASRGRGAADALHGRLQAGYNHLPAVSYASPGEYILWHNGELLDEGIYHTVTADDGSFESGPLNLHYLWGIDMPLEPGAQVRCHCEFHDWMVGLIVVI